MKKILTAAVAVMLVLTMMFVYTGCGKKDDASAGTSAEANAASDLGAIKEKGELVIGITLFAPMDYYEDGSDELVGFEADFARAVCEKLGVTATFQEIKWEAKETELNSKNIDCIWNGMTITPEREENMSISTPYMANKQIVVIKADKAAEIEKNGLAGLNVVAEQESAGEEVINEDKAFEGCNYTPVDSMAAAMRDVKAGTADACVIDYITALGSIGEGTDYADLAKIDSLSFADEQYGIAFRKGSDITAEVNAIIDQLAKDGTLQKIAEKYNIADSLLVK